ncbi:hypothetical protein MRX96_038493 [Rhipicephalus microplus]
MSTMGRHARNIFRTFELSEEQSKDYEVVKKHFDAYFVATRNSVYESARFHCRHQAAGESVDQYVTALHTLADRCDYGIMKERMILDRFVVGTMGLQAVRGPPNGRNTESENCTV